MNPVVIFRHAHHEGPGYFADFLDRKGIARRLFRIDCNDPLPQSLDGISGLVFMGGPMSVNDNLPWIPQVVSLIKQAVAADVPVLGHCLGGQLIAKALGGTVTRNPVPEIGWLPVTRSENPEAQAWLNGGPLEFEVYHWHGETFSIPAGATRILSSRHCANQAFVIGKTLALQCHVEMTPEMIENWAELGAEKLAPSATVQTPAQMVRDLAERVPRLHQIADKLYERWVQGLAR